MSQTNSSIFDIFGGGALKAAGAQSDYIMQAMRQAMPQFQTGIQQLQNYGQNALTPINLNWQNQQAGVTKLADLLGLNGASGTSGALKTLENMPGYQFTVDQGNKAIQAQGAATGGTGGGNEALALEKFGQNAAQTNYNNYLQQLMPYLNASNQSGGQIAGTNLGIGQNVMQGFNNMGNMLYGGLSSLGNVAANGILGATQGIGNLWNLGSNILGGLAGSGLGSGLLSLSDAKLKEDIEPVGALASGETIYRYRFKGEPRTQIGLIAQEVEGVTPEAVIEFLPDLRAVDYHRATERAAKILEFSRMRGEPTPQHRPFAYELMELAA